MEEYAWISKVAHHPVFSGRSHPILLRLAEHYKVQISIAGPDNRDCEPYVQAVYDAIGRKVAGMMIIGWGNKEIVPAVDAAMASGIPVVCVDRDIPRSRRYAYIGTDWFRMGRKMADNLADLTAERGKILIAGTTDLDNVKDSVLGFKHQISRYPNLEVLDTIDGLTEDPDQAETIIAGYLSKNPDLSGMVGFDGEGSCAAAKALLSMGLADSVKLICVDADAPQFQLVKSGVIDAAFYQKREASTYLAFQLLYDFNHGSRATGYTPGAINIPGNIDTGFIIITRNNIDHFDSEIRLDQAVQHHELSQRLSLISSMIENVEELAIAADDK
jgi:ribose transport system substrate-binding protein